MPNEGARAVDGSGAAATPPAVPSAVIEQYKAKLADLGNLGARHTAMTTYYVSILTALLGVLAFKDRKLADIDLPIILVVTLGGVLVSLLWAAGIAFFDGTFAAKLSVLKKIEAGMPFQTFEEEFSVTNGAHRLSWLKTERKVPFVFAALFALVLVARLLC